jgi:undecaprenyl-diphosphatase
MLGRDRYTAVQVALCVVGGMLTNTGLKNIFDRTRPHFDPALAQAYGYSFPSGHVTAATLLYGSLMLLAWRQIPARPARIAVVVALFFLVQLIALSRMYLGVHYLTDVLAAQILGAIWITFTFTTAEILRRRRLALSKSRPTAGTS